jgi:Spherulation-specific family 4
MKRLGLLITTLAALAFPAGASAVKITEDFSEAPGQLTVKWNEATGSGSDILWSLTGVPWPENELHAEGLSTGITETQLLHLRLAREYTAHVYISTLNSDQKNASTLGVASLIPFYWSGHASQAEWEEVCSTAPAGSTIILNNNTGPGSTSELEKSAEIVSYCHGLGKNLHVLGYVYTDYALEKEVSGHVYTKAYVESQINEWHTKVAALDGIFYDGFGYGFASKSQGETEAFYKGLPTWSGEWRTGNHGDEEENGWALEKEVLRTIVIWEKPNLTGFSKKYEWIKKAGPSQVAVIVNEGDQELMESDCKTLQEEGIGYIFVSANSAYASLPSYWATEKENC